MKDDAMKYFSRAARFVFASVACAALWGAPSSAQDANYPTRPIELVVPFSAGGGVDAVARRLGDRMSSILGQPIIVVNRPGVGGHAGAMHVARSNPDGYTLLVAPTTTLALASLVVTDNRYTPSKDLTPVSILVSLPQILMVGPGSSFKTLGDLMNYAKANPSKVSVGTCSKGCGQYVAVELLMKSAGIALNHVPYKGTADALRDLMGGVLDMALIDPPSLSPARAANLRPLVITSETRLKSLPDTPTVAETLKGYEAATHYALLAPANTPKDIIAKLNAAVSKAFADRTLTDRLEAEGMSYYSESPAFAAQFIRGQYDKWHKFLKESGVEPR